MEMGPNPLGETWRETTLMKSLKKPFGNHDKFLVVRTLRGHQ